MAYLYFGSGSSSSGTNVRTRYSSAIELNFSVAAKYVLDLNYLDSVDQDVYFVPGENLAISNPS